MYFWGTFPPIFPCIWPMYDWPSMSIFVQYSSITVWNIKKFKHINSVDSSINNFFQLYSRLWIDEAKFLEWQCLVISLCTLNFTKKLGAGINFCVSLGGIRIPCNWLSQLTVIRAANWERVESPDRVYLPEHVGFAFWVVWAFAQVSGFHQEYLIHMSNMPANCNDPPAIIISSFL